MNTDPANSRIAIVDAEKCKPKRCALECKTSCPVVRTGRACVDAKHEMKLAAISEELCIGCGICIKRCPFDAIDIINVPKSLDKETVHRYGKNSFKLHRLPLPRAGQVLGLVGTNGIGKSTALQILQGKLKPNLGNFDNPPEWKDILKFFQGNELQNYLTKIVSEDIDSAVKPQYVDNLPRAIKGARNVGEILRRRVERVDLDQLAKSLDLDQLMDRDIDQLSGGELQRFAIAVTIGRNCNVFMFDEPSSYLDVHQRLTAARMIRNIVQDDRSFYVVVVEHDLAVLDYLSDFVCVLYGRAGAYGIVTMPFNVRDGINIFLQGFIPTENMRFREEELSFKMVETADDTIKKSDIKMHMYPKMTKTLKGKNGTQFKLTVEPGSFRDTQIIVLLGENGTGKTTFIRMLAGVLKSDEQESGEDNSIPEMSVSYKPQTIAPKFEGTVRELFMKKIQQSMLHPQFQSDVMKPLSIEPLLDQPVKTLSGGELQRVAITLVLGVPSEIYLIDEPSAYLDSEQRIVSSKVIKRFIYHTKKTAFIVEHDFIMATYLADQVIVYTGSPGIDCVANSPQGLLSGMNKFLKSLEITFRRDPTNYRPRINKFESVKDREQKESGNYFFMDEE